MYQSDSLDLSQIIKGCIKGDEAYQRVLFERYYGQLMGICMRYAANRAEAEDLLHDGFLKIFKRIQGYKGTGSFEGWMKRIVINNAIDVCRKKSNTTVYSIDDEHSHELEDMDKVESEDGAEWIKNIDLHVLLGEIQKLSDAYRTVFNLYVLEDYSHQDIADELGISVGTSKSNLAKAKKNLRKSLEALIEKKYVG